MDPNIPNLTDFQSLENYFYFSKQELKAAEIYFLDKLDYILSFYTAYDFLRIFLTYGFLFDCDLKFLKFKSQVHDVNINCNQPSHEAGEKLINKNLHPNIDETIEAMYNTAYSVLNATIENNEILGCMDNFKLACAVIAVTREYFLLEENFISDEVKNFKWNNLLIKLYSIEFEQFQQQYEFVKG